MGGVTDATVPIQVTWNEKLGKFHVSEEGERYFLTAEEMKRVCRIALETKDVIQTLGELLNDLGIWAKKHAGKIERAFLTVRDTGLLFLVVMKHRRHDRDLEDDLTDLDMEIARKYEDVSLSVLAVPHCRKEAYLSFVNPEFCLSYEGLHAGRKRTRGARPA